MGLPYFFAFKSLQVAWLSLSLSLCSSQTKNDVIPMQSESVSFRKTLQVLCVFIYRHCGALLASTYKNKGIFKACNKSDQLDVFFCKTGIYLCTQPTVGLENMSKYRKQAVSVLVFVHVKVFQYCREENPYNYSGRIMRQTVKFFRRYCLNAMAHKFK